MLLHLKEGAHVITFDEIGVSAGGRKASTRDKDGLGSQMSVSKRPYEKGGVSWTDKGGDYLFHVMQGEK